MGGRSKARWKRARRLAQLAILTGMVLLPGSNASAQRGLDRALTTSRGTGPEPEVEEVDRRPAFLTPEPAETLLRASWLLQPLGTFSGSDSDLGLLAGYRNQGRFGSWRWQLTARGLRRYRSGTAHARWQVDGEIWPPVDKLTALPLTAIIGATHAHTIDIGRSDVLWTQLDVAIPVDSGMELSLGPIGYYAWESPQGGEASDGAIFGLIGYWGWGRFYLLPEYDFSSDIAGGDYYLVTASYRLTAESSKIELRLVGGWDKGDTYSLRLELGVPHNKRKRRNPLRQAHIINRARLR